MPKPLGTCGSTKMKILAIICHNGDRGNESYGYDIWKTMKESFHIYLGDNDIGNVYRHLNDLCTLNFITRADEDPDGRCFYRITEDGIALQTKYNHFLDLLENELK